MNIATNTTLKTTFPAGERGLPASSTAWFAVHVKRSMESVVDAHLRNNGFETFLPMCQTRRLWSDRVKTVDLPLFPGYVFCEFSPASKLEIEYLPGVTGVLSFGNKLAEVNRDELTAIRSVMATGLKFRQWPRLESGRTVEIHRGPLKGLMGVVVDDQDQCRLILSVTLLNRSVSVEMDRSWLR